MKLVIKIIFLVGIIILSNCGDNPAENDFGEFALEISVSDQNLDPLASVNVSVWNKTINHTTIFPKTNTTENVEATTSLQFELKQDCIVNLTIYDLENNIVDRLINNDSKVAGNHMVAYSNSDIVGTRVFKCKLEIKDDSISNSVIFSDSIYSVITSPDPEMSQIGITNEDGKFETAMKLLFPNLYELPELIRTNSGSHNQIGTFSISDEVVIALTDNNGQTKYYEKEITDGENIIRLKWNEGSDELPDWQLVAPLFPNKLFSTKDDPLPTIPNEFKLYQNFPNPFN